MQAHQTDIGLSGIVYAIAIFHERKISNTIEEVNWINLTGYYKDQPVIGQVNVLKSSRNPVLHCFKVNGAADFTMWTAGP
jgi:hypothetical protein